MNTRGTHPESHKLGQRQRRHRANWLTLVDSDSGGLVGDTVDNDIHVGTGVVVHLVGVASTGELFVEEGGTSLSVRMGVRRIGSNGLRQDM